MSPPARFTQADVARSIRARAIKGVEPAGRFVAGVRPDGTPLVSDKPVASMIWISVSGAGALTGDHVVRGGSLR